MIYIMTMCVGLVWGICGTVVTQEYPSMVACMDDRDHQRALTHNLIWVKCEEIKTREKK